MTRFSPSRSNFLALCVAGALLGAPTASFADSSHAPAITEARADGAMLRITGLELAGGTPKLTLGSAVLSIVSATATHIDALLPVGVAPGSYLLTLTLAKGKNDRSDDNSKYDEFWVTIGGAGAAGKDGVAGPQGAAGAPGPQGPAGKDGLPGAQGLAGPVGKDGLPGAQGLQGPAGKDGAPGREGPVGPAGRDGAQGPEGKEGSPGAQGPVGPTGPQGPAGAGGALASIASLGGLPCSVAMCPGTTALTFDSLTSAARLSCVRLPGNNTLHLQGSASLQAKISPSENSLSFTSDVQGYAGAIPFGGGQVAAIQVAGLCEGQVVSVTVTLGGPTGPVARAVTVTGGTCANALLWDDLRSTSSLSVTCNFTMNGDQILTIQ